MTENMEAQLEGAIRGALEKRAATAIELLHDVNSAGDVSASGVQRVVYRMMSAGSLELGPGFRLKIVR